MLPLIEHGLPPATPPVEYNRYATLNPSELAKSARTSESRYRKAAYTALVIGVTLLVGLVVSGAVVAALFLPPTGAVIASAGTFLLGVAVYNFLVKKKIFVPLKAQEMEARKQAEINEGYARSIQEVRGSEHGLSNENYNLIGMAKYWGDNSRKTLREIEGVKSQFLALDSRLNVQQTLLREHLHQLKEGDFLSAKLYAAYFVHLAGNPTDTRSFEDFATITPVSMLDVDNHHRANQLRKERGKDTIHKAPYLVSPSIELYRKNIKTDTMGHLSQQIFRRQEVA